jgi:hypothetical protein
MVSVLAVCLLQTSNDALTKLADRIDQLGSVAFDYRRDLNYASDGYKHTIAVRVYVEFGKTWRPLGARYRVISEAHDEGFDGVSYWCRLKGHTPIHMLSPEASYFGSVSVLRNSLIGLSASLRAAKGSGKILESAGDTFTFELKGQEVSAAKPLVPVEYSPQYEIKVDSKSGLPVKIVHRLKDRRDTITTSFANYDLAPKAIDWYAGMP